MNAFPDLIPVNVITGFLGSGKTSIIQRLLASPDLRDTAVLVNEFGEIGLDHDVLQHLNENTILLGNGCVCCAIRGDLKDALRDLFSQLTRKEIRPFGRVIIETSGLADPVPIAYTIQSEPVLRHHFRIGNTVTAIDAVNGLQHLARYCESIKQVAVADFLIITKSDLADGGQVEALRKKLAHLNAGAPIIDGAETELDPAELFSGDLSDAASRTGAAKSWSSRLADHHDAGLAHEHSEGVHSISIHFDTPLDWTAFGIWMTMLLHRHGDRVLRIKGLLNVRDVDTPLLINGVQHIVHAPVHLPAWPDDDHRSRLVFIVDGINGDDIRRSLMAFNQLANPVFENV